MASVNMSSIDDNLICANFQLDIWLAGYLVAKKLLAPTDTDQSDAQDKHIKHCEQGLYLAETS